MKILYIGKFNKMWDEEYIVRSLESLGHEVGKTGESSGFGTIISDIDYFKPDIVMFAKFINPHAQKVIEECRKRKIKTICWVFDLYWNYTREYQLDYPNFRADYVFTTDGGEHDWKGRGINHQCVRQGIYKPECLMLQAPKEYDVVFVGTFNGNNQQRNSVLDRIELDFDFKWFGKENPDEIRGLELNKLYAKSKVIIGDSVYSPYYWSNRVVETLGRGGFLIHQEVEGLKEEYPYLVTYKRGDYQDLKSKIEYYLAHNEEREEIIRKNYEWVLNNYTCDKKCAELIKACE